MEEIKTKAAYYAAQFYPGAQDLQACYNAFLEELRTGLKAHREDPNSFDPMRCSLMMLDSCVDTIPSGRERGIFYAVDFGGTNIRAIRCSLDGKGACSMTAIKHNMRTDNLEGMPKGLLDAKAPASLLFDDIAGVVYNLMEREGDLKKDIPVGFTFSFGTNQKSLKCATLTGWTKDFETGMATNDPVVGRDVGALLDNAFARKGMRARVVAVLNDTVGALLSGNYCKTPDQPPCLVGVILGTGVNGAYVQPDAKTYAYQGLVMNTECGGFNKGMCFTDIDDEIDFLSTAPGRQRFEKMVSGMYLPEIVRLLIVRVFMSQAPDAAWVPNTLTGEGCGAILNDACAPFTTTASVFQDLWDWNPPTEALPVLQQLVRAVFTRSAAISAALIAGMCKATGRLQPAMGGLTVGLDGSLYVLNESYQREVRHYLEVVLGKRTADLIRTVIARDGSGMGAAILAAAATSQRKK